jgi:hypothetical protein
MEEERRQRERSHLIHYLRVFDNKSGIFLGNMVNLTQNGGVQLISEAPMMIGKQFELRMDFPPEEESGENIIFNAECRWCRTDIFPELFAIGLRSIDIPPEKIRVFRNLIETYIDELNR